MKKKWIRDALLFGIQTKMWKIMRLNAIFLLLCFSHAWALSGYSQETKLTLKMSDSKVIEVLDAIEEQSEFFFLFNQKLVDVERKVDIDVQVKSIDFILQNLFAGTNVNHMVLDRQIVLTTFNEQLLPQQQPALSGKVTDSGGQPLPGVTVVVKGTTQGTVTNADGNYSLSNIPENATLMFSFVGMRTQEIEVENQNSIDVTMIFDAIGIEEVVAIGYGTIRKSDLTGSVSSVTEDALKSVPMANLTQGLQGRAAGVNVRTTDSSPGGNVSIRIRGGNSITAGNDALYVVDGFVGIDNINNINPQDIESVEILKDASATAIYGARAANGVVLITTKRGKAGETLIQFDSYLGTQSFVNKLDLMNADQYSNFLLEARGENISNSELTNDWKLIGYENTDTDWQNEVLRDAPIQNYSLRLSGGTNSVKYMVSGEYFDQEGIVLNSGFKRYAFRTNLDFEVNKKMDVGLNLTLSQGLQKSSNPLFIVGEAPPTLPVDYRGINPYNEERQRFENPLLEALNNNNNINSSKFLGHIFSRYRLSSSLTFQTSVMSS